AAGQIDAGRSDDEIAGLRCRGRFLDGDRGAGGGTAERRRCLDQGNEESDRQSGASEEAAGARAYAVLPRSRRLHQALDGHGNPHEAYSRESATEIKLAASCVVPAAFRSDRYASLHTAKEHNDASGS